MSFATFRRRPSCHACGFDLTAGSTICEGCGHDNSVKRKRGTIKLIGAGASAVHSRSGALDKPEIAHDAERAVVLNRMQRTPREDFDVVLTSASLGVLFRLALCAGGWLQRTSVIGTSLNVTREDVAALIRGGWVQEIPKGFEITDAGNDLVRELVSFTQVKLSAVGGGGKS